MAPTAPIRFLDEDEPTACDASGDATLTAERDARATVGTAAEREASVNCETAGEIDALIIVGWDLDTNLALVADTTAEVGVFEVAAVLRTVDAAVVAVVTAAGPVDTVDMDDDAGKTVVTDDDFKDNAGVEDGTIFCAVVAATADTAFEPPLPLGVLSAADDLGKEILSLPFLSG